MGLCLQRRNYRLEEEFRYTFTIFEATGSTFWNNPLFLRYFDIPGDAERCNPVEGTDKWFIVCSSSLPTNTLGDGM